MPRSGDLEGMFRRVQAAVEAAMQERLPLRASFKEPADSTNRTHRSARRGKPKVHRKDAKDRK